MFSCEIRSMLFALLLVFYLFNRGDVRAENKAARQRRLFRGAQSTERSASCGSKDATYAHTSHASELGPFSVRQDMNAKGQRVLQQSAEAEVENSAGDECHLRPDEVRRIYDADRGTWLVDSTVMDEVEGDLQRIINCTEKGDSVLFSVTRRIKPSSRIVISWPLALSAYVANTEFSDGMFPRSRLRTRITCPRQNEGVISSKTADLTLANLVFEGCSFNLSKAHGSIVNIERSSSKRAEGTIRLHHVAFRNNVLIGSVAVNASSDSRSVLEIYNFEFQDNNCSGVCAALLADENRLQGLAIKQNQAAKALHSKPVIFRAPVRSRIEARHISGAENNGAFFEIASGHLELSNSTFSKNSAIQATDEVSSCIELRNSTASIEDCAFRKNIANFGAAISAYETIITITNSTFKKNIARKKGTLFLREETSLLVQSCVFSSNSAEVSGGAIDAAHASVIINQSTFERNEARFSSRRTRVDGEVIAENTNEEENCRDQPSGGAAALENASVVIEDSRIVSNSASTSGGGLYIRSASIELKKVILDGNVAETHGGGIYVESASIDLMETTVGGNRALNDGGGIYVQSASVTMRQAILDGNRADKHGGGIYVQSVTAIVTESNLARNRARHRGGGVYGEDSAITVEKAIITENHAGNCGGGISVLTSTNLTVRNSMFRMNEAECGGSVFGDSAILNIFDASFRNGKASSRGGFISASSRSSVHVENASMADALAEGGGAVDLDSSTLKARLLNVTRSKANADGGVLMARSSSLLCVDCTLRESVAERNGGAICYEAIEIQEVELQLKRCNIVNNSAETGGGLHFVSPWTGKECLDSGDECAFAAIIDTRFENNSASLAGGAIMARYVDAIRFDCAPATGNLSLTFLGEEDWKRLLRILSEEDFCPAWKENQAGTYGDVVGSYALQAEMVFEPMEKVTEIHRGEVYLLADYQSGTQLPTMTVHLLDRLQQEPPFDYGEITAHISTTGPFLLEDLSAFVINGSATLPRIIGLGPPGTYNMTITFNERATKDLTIVIVIRNCTIGEATSRETKLCMNCTSSSYNFDPEAEKCQPCPENGNCETRVILPNQGHWHRTPCSKHIQRCLASDACDVEGRESDLIEAGIHVNSCQFDEEYLTNYTELQCREGHEGPLCGSCKDSYGKSYSFFCEKCYSPFSSFILVFLSFLILLCLSGVTIRSNMTSTVSFSPTEHADDSELSSTPRSTGSVPVNEQMMEMWITGDIPDEILNPVQSPRMNLGQSSDDPELAKWKAVELFKVTSSMFLMHTLMTSAVLKITVNFLQVTAIAAAVNVKWTLTMIALFEGAELISGITSAAFSLSTDCLIPSGGIVEHSVARALFDFSKPLVVMFVIAALLFMLKIRHKEPWLSLIKKIMLSILAVCYISYISISETLISILNCIEVHDSIDANIDHTTDYWALDTGIKCYEGSHAVLAGFLGWPFLVIFVFGFPLTIGYVIIKQVVSDYKEGWIYSVSGFLYRSYRKKYVFWESLIMLRKAMLAVIVVFSYPLGADLQQVLAVFVLIFALYLQMVCRPYRSEFEILNEMESASIFISTLTFVSSIFFTEGRVSPALRVLVTSVIVLSNIALFLCLFSFFLIFTGRFLRSVVDRERVPYDPNRGSLYILSVYLIHCILGRFKDRLLALMRRKRAEPHTRL